MGFWRDGIGRLTFEPPGVESADYPAVCRELADHLGLAPEGEIIIGPEQMFWKFRRGEQVVSLDWDIWMQFMVMAPSEGSEPLLREIASWLTTSRWSSTAESGNTDVSSSEHP